MRKFAIAAGAHKFGPKWWSDSAKSTFWVIIITLLIWVYADMEVTQSTEVRITVKLTTSNISEVVLLSSPVHEIVFKLRGSSNSLRIFNKLYGNTSQEFNLSNYKAGSNQAVPVAEILEGIREFGELGLAMESAEPKAITAVNLDPLEEHIVPVEFVYTGADLEAQPKATAPILIASTHWKQLAARSKATTIRTAEQDLKAMTPGQKKTVTFELVSQIDSFPVRLDKKTVTVDIQVMKRTADKILTVTVKALTPPAWMTNGVWKEYKLKQKDVVEWRPKITVIGPREDLGKLSPDKIEAFIELVEDDKTPVGSWLTRKVVFRFPPELNVRLKPGTPEPSVQFRLDKRKPSN